MMIGWLFEIKHLIEDNWQLAVLIELSIIVIWNLGAYMGLLRARKKKRESDYTFSSEYDPYYWKHEPKEGKPEEKSGKIKIERKPAKVRKIKEKYYSWKKKDPLISQTYTEWFKRKFYKSRVVLINMELINGNHTTFWKIIDEKEGFKWRGKKYILDNESRYYNLDAGAWMYDFHEQFSLPIKRSIPLEKIKKTIEASDITQVELATNPSTLDRFIRAEIAEGIMKGHQLEEFMKQLRLMIIIILVASVLHLVLFAWKSGMLSQIKIPGIS